MKSYTDDIKNYIDGLIDVLKQMDTKQIDRAMHLIMETYEKDGTIYIFGNGGSASTASHFVCDFNKGVSLHLDKKFRFVCLNDNVASVMAIANDCGYENIFSIQLENKLRPEDILIAISGSGNSKNVLKAVEYAKSKGNKIMSLTGYDGGRLMKLADCPVHVNINDMQKAEDVHMMLDHLMSQILAKALGHPMC